MVQVTLTFPPNFLWGTATAAHHVEGNMNNSWSHWENMEPGVIFQNHKHGRACEWWDGRWVEDFDRMQYLGHTTHRLSIEWSRIQPTPDGIDDTAVEKYRDMLQGLKQRGMRPMVSLHHFTNPMWFEDEGGWLSHRAVDRFTHWTQIAVERFGDLVDLWCTFNEPMVYAVQAYLVGMFYPGGHNLRKFYKASELLMRAHADSYHTIKAKYPSVEVGFAKHFLKLDALPPRLINQRPVQLVHRIFNMAFMEAAVTGMIELPWRKSVHVPELADSMDYMGVNFYQRYRGGLAPFSPKTLFLKQVPEPDAPYSPPMWGEIYPQGLFEILKMVWKVARKPIYITETGTPDKGDEVRRWYIARALHSVWHAINFNIPVKGIYYWTLLDNFEWTAGYNPEFKFGLYETNFETQERTLRPSGEFFREISLANALTSAMVEQYSPDLLPKLFPSSVGENTVTLK